MGRVRGLLSFMREYQILRRKNIHMMLIYALRWLLLALEVLIALPVLYLCIVSLSAIMNDKRRRAKNASVSAKIADTGPTFAILIPAHNEESVIAKLLSSLARLTYPKDRFAVHVVADNCTDATVSIVCATGWANVHERFNKDKRGKGYALN